MDNKPGASSLHPLMIAAALSVILLSGVGIAFMTGILPKIKTTDTTPAAVLAPEKADDNSMATAPATVAEKANEAEVPPKKPAAHHVEHRTGSHTEQRAASAKNPAPAPLCYDCGTVTSVNAVTVQGSASGLGAVGGAVAGGVVGHQVGGGKGRDAMTVLGAIGGALAGNQIEKSRRQTTRYDVIVRMEDGSNRTFSYDTVPAVSSGDRVRVSNGELVRN